MQTVDRTLQLKLNEAQMMRHKQGFEIQTDHLISARRPDLVMENNKKRELAELWILLSQGTAG